MIGYEGHEWSQMFVATVELRSVDDLDSDRVISGWSPDQVIDALA
jgi:hypothetical protein